MDAESDHIKYLEDRLRQAEEDRGRLLQIFNEISIYFKLREEELEEMKKRDQEV